MSTWERAVALAIGVLAGGGGGWAVFVSDNQAGTAVLLLMAAAFLLIGVQGTPLIKFDSTSGNLELERRMRKRAEKVIEASKDEENPDVAKGLLDAAAILEPELIGDSPQALGLAYEMRVGKALRGLFDEVRDAGACEYTDYLVETPLGVTAVEAKYRHRRPLNLRDVEDVVRKIDSGGESIRKILIVTNSVLSGQVRELNREGNFMGRPVEVITWNDSGDNDLLGRAIPRV